MLEEQGIQTWMFQLFEDADFVLVLHVHGVQPHVFFETNRKQTTNLYKPVFDVFEQTAVLVPKQQQKFFLLPWNVKGHSSRDVCAPAHFSSQGSTRAKLGSNKSQSKGQETSSDFVVSFGSLEQKLELERDGLCV